VKCETTNEIHLRSADVRPSLESGHYVSPNQHVRPLIAPLFDCIRTSNQQKYSRHDHFKTANISLQLKTVTFSLRLFEFFDLFLTDCSRFFSLTRTRNVCRFSPARPFVFLRTHEPLPALPPSPSSTRVVCNLHRNMFSVSDDCLPRLMGEVRNRKCVDLLRPATT